MPYDLCLMSREMCNEYERQMTCTGDVQEHVQQEVRMKFSETLQKIREYEFTLAEAEDWP